MTPEPADGFLLLTLVDVHAQQMGGPGFMIRDDQMRAFWQADQHREDRLAIFLEHLHQRILSIASRYCLGPNHPLVPRVDTANCLVYFRTGPNLIRVNLIRGCLELMEGPLEEIPPYLRVYFQPVSVSE